MQIKHRVRKLAIRTLLASVAGVSAVALTASPAAAADDGFEVYNASACGSVEFVDYGPGAAGGGNNDDYTLIHDYCSDGIGIRAYAWLNNVYLGTQYSGNGLAGAAKVWDPFGNVTGGQKITLQVCLSNGSGGSPYACSAEIYRYSIDG